MTKTRKAFFIINRYSGAGYRKGLEGLIIAHCDKSNIEGTIEFTRSQGHATVLAEQAVKDRFDMVFAVGGDGTVNEVANGLIDTDVVMGILPKGSGNGLTRHLGIPLRISKALDLLDSTNHVAMDVLVINGKLSLNVSGIGFDAHIANCFGEDGVRGLAGYMKSALKEFISYPEFTVRAVIDGEELIRKVFVLAIANSSQFGNNARVAPLASVCDSLIDFCFIRKVKGLHVVDFITKLFSGRMDHSGYVEMRQARSAEFFFDEPKVYHVDGEPQKPEKHFIVEIRPAALKMLIPEEVMMEKV